RYWHLNRNKRSLALDLKAPGGKQAFCDLVKKSDVVVSNFRPGVMSRLGIGYESVRKINPRIIWSESSGFGPAGPYRDRPSVDPIGQMISGLAGLNREPGKLPNLYGVPIADFVTSMFVAQGIMAALYSRENSGLGQMVETSLLDCCIAALAYVGAYYLNSGIQRGINDPQFRGGASSGIFETKDDYIYFSVLSPERQWPSFCKALEHEELMQDARFATISNRQEHGEELRSLVEGILRTRTTSEWVERLMKEDIPVSPINSLAQVFSDPQVRQGSMVSITEYQGKQYKVIGNPMHMSEMEHQAYNPPPTPGQHTEEILSQILGYPQQKIEELRKAGAV
ncbi:MAG: CoA transferase, partial [Chloroflexi bacterium]|nr:CoA transferase [Chloroflexota bacterium]